MSFEQITNINNENNIIFLFLFIVLIIIEIFIVTINYKTNYDYSDSAGSVGVAIGNLIFKPITKGFLFLVFSFTQNFAISHFPINNVWVWVAGFFAMEFAYYWQHRFMHEIRFMWLSHMVHHSSNVFTLPSAIRLSWVSLTSLSWVVYLPLVIIGFPPIMIAILMSLNLSYQFLLHTEIFGKWHLWGIIFNTPEHHKIHHASNEEYIDKNYGGILIIFDKMFGTFASIKPQAKPKFGLTKPILSNNPFVIVFSGWYDFIQDCLKSRNFGDLAMNIFGKPK